jgi:hypothetical protein
MNPDDGADSVSPPEERLLEHLYALREDAPEPGNALAAAVLGSARWQAAVRPFAQAAGRLMGGMGDSLRIMAGRTAS